MAQILDNSELDDVGPGQRVRRRRELLELTASQISERTGINAKKLGRIEREEQLMDTDDIIALSKALKMDANHILFGIGPVPHLPNIISSELSPEENKYYSLPERFKAVVDQLVDSLLSHHKEMRDAYGDPVELDKD